MGTREGGKKAAETLKEERGEDYFQKIGQKGGKAADQKKSAQTTKERHGEDFYQKIGEKGGRSSHRGQ